ncbi:ABC transporter substrate-binding protein [Burkholderia pyrrocinia]|uniref:ABC transporter substrate-binding protein n=1 Tax=Burkholderia pyrrocinia TaxID=60550 RepID=UPI001BCCF193|nr:ABC transporter substrate-binding protein [Burkholderia pyrrocinia]QVN21287.1 ABC transporter substrate-binding protein [Burkholderia pyrrocinia]
MNRRRILLGVAASAFAPKSTLAASAIKPIRVVFLNPGESVERATGQQWQLVVRFMVAAAKALDMQLEVLYAERDHLLMLRQAEALTKRHTAPDYVVLVNEKRMASRMLSVLGRMPSKVVLIHNDLTEAQRQEVGNERERIVNWIGTVTADAKRAGYRLMEYLHQRQANATVPQVIGITGDPLTPVSLERAEGVYEWLINEPGAHLNQLVYGNWSFSDSYEKTRALLRRYPNTNLIWAANDSMAIGALKACEAYGARPIVGGMGALPDALVSVMRGGLTAMMAGTYFIGAFAMVLIYDYHEGFDFAEHGGARRKLDVLKLVHRGNASSYYERLFGGLGDPDFSALSRARHRKLADYDFNIDRLLDNIKKFS